MQAIPNPDHDTGPVGPLGRLTGRKVLLIFVLFFGTIIAADTFLLTSAIRTFTGLETTSPYKAGQLYNAEIAMAHAQDARGWTLAARAARGSDGAVTVTAEASDRSGSPLIGRVLQAALQRPTDGRADRTGVTLKPTGTPGRYAGTVDAVAPGQWDLVVDVIEEGERAFRRKVRVMLP